MDDFLVDMDMWMCCTENTEGPKGFYYRMQLTGEVRRAMEIAKNAQTEHDESKVNLERNWTAFNFQSYTDASWNLMAGKKNLDLIVKKVAEEIHFWKLYNTSI
jgi:hypothetical protein